MLTILCPRGSKLENLAQSAGLSTIPVPKHSFVTAAIARLTQELQSGTVNLLHAHNGVTNAVAAVCKSFAKTSVSISTIHTLSRKRTERKGLSAFFLRTRRTTGWPQEQISTLQCPTLCY